MKLSFNPHMQQQRKHFAACGRMASLGTHTFTFHLESFSAVLQRHGLAKFDLFICYYNLNLNAFCVCITIASFKKKLHASGKEFAFLVSGKYCPRCWALPDILVFRVLHLYCLPLFSLLCRSTGNTKISIRYPKCSNAFL